MPCDPQHRERKLPTRRRTVTPNAAAGDAANTNNPFVADTCQSAVVPTPIQDVTVTPDLIAELVNNGSLAAHFRIIQGVEMRTGWRSSNMVEIEIECGSTLLVVDLQELLSTNRDPTTKCTLDHHPRPALPLLLRTFHRQSQQVGNQRNGLDLNANHVLVPVSRTTLHDWAPVNVLHVAKALELCDFPLVGPVFIHQTHRIVHVMPTVPAYLLSGIATRYIITERHQTTLAPNGNTSVVNWKVKYTVPVSYPAGQSDVVHIAWETNDPNATPNEDLVCGSRRRGLLPVACHCCEAPPLGGAVKGDGLTTTPPPYVKVEWTASGPICQVVLRLGVLLQKSVSADGFRQRLLKLPRPRSSTDVPHWLHAVGAQCAEWRVEVELVPPIQVHGIVSVLYLHHLIRRLVGTTQAIPRSQFVSLFRDQQSKTDPARLCAAGVQIALANLCRRQGIRTNGRTGYPLQSRPHDLTEVDLVRLIHTVVTPKVNGLEAFLLGHRGGLAVVFRSGIVHTHPWSVPHTPLFPLLLEGEVLCDAEDATRNRVMHFIAYDVVVTPVQSYVERGQFSTRHACLRALTSQIRRHCIVKEGEEIRVPSAKKNNHPQHSVADNAVGHSLQTVLSDDAQPPSVYTLVPCVGRHNPHSV